MKIIYRFRRGERGDAENAKKIENISPEKLLTGYLFFDLVFSLQSLRLRVLCVESG